MDEKGNTSSSHSASSSVEVSKLKIYSFMESLFKISMSEDALVDMVIDDNPNENKVIIVGRPKLLGSSTKQMRHVTPYAFIEHAIKSVIISEVDKPTHRSYVNNIVDTIRPLIKSKRGICLTTDQYRSLLLSVSAKDIDEINEAFKLMTITPEQQRNEYHLIHNDSLIEQFEQSKLFDNSLKEKAFSDFNSKFEKYIDYGISYLKRNIMNKNDLNVIIMTCEGLARIILTMFNQDKYAAFPQEGNSLLEEIRLYKSKKVEEESRNISLQVQKERKLFEVKSHDEMSMEIIRSSDQKTYDLRVRIVENEGIKVKNTAEALRILDMLISRKDSRHANTEKIKKEENNYNDKYNLQVNIKGLNLKDYNNKISVEHNLDNIFQHHVAKHLYVVFDFKPLEKNVLVPKETKDRNAIKVYPSANGTTTAEYLVKSGSEYRESQYNSRKGYNDKAVFRLKMQDKEIEEVLRRKVISHIIVSLIPFQSIRIGFDRESNNQVGMRKVFESFVDLVQKDYESVKSKGNTKLKGKDSVEVNLDDDWKKKLYEEY